MLPATFPPTSEEWMKLKPKPISSPSAKIGFHSQMSGRCVERPCVRSGSFVIPMSPSSYSPRASIAVLAGNPTIRLTAVSVGAAITSPFGATRQAPKSEVSLTKTVNPVRRVTAAISSAIDFILVRRISSMTWSVFTSPLLPRSGSATRRPLLRSRPERTRSCLPPRRPPAPRSSAWQRGPRGRRPPQSGACPRRRPPARCAGRPASTTTWAAPAAASASRRRSSRAG